MNDEVRKMLGYNSIARLHHASVGFCVAVTAFLFLSALASCSPIADDERLIYVKPADVTRKVLIEDFTGQRCVNCPMATLEIEKLQQQYGRDNVIAVGIHSGPLGFKGTAAAVGLATELGDEYYSHWDISYQPQGMVSRSGGKLDYEQWAAKVSELIQQQSSVQLQLQCDYDASSRQLSTTLTTLGTNGATQGKVQLWVVEDSVTAMQLRYNEIDKPTSGQFTDRNYVHNHVLRQAINGTWGEDFSCAEGEQQQLVYTFTVDEAWRADHLSVVAFIYNDQGVVQAEQQHFFQTQK